MSDHFDPTDFSDMADFAGVVQRQQISRQLRESQQAQQGPQCPACGGVLPGQYQLCKHCNTQLVWLEGYPCQVGHEAEQLAQYRQQAASLERAETLRKKKASDEMNAAYVLLVCGFVPIFVFFFRVIGSL